MTTEEIIIAIDGMGGDNAPSSVINASHMFTPADKIKLIVVGDEKQIKNKIALEKYPFVTLEHCGNSVRRTRR